ncbi:hypothetical protein E2320_009419 [Naja naja]|nr:hypothetical protein E2320_009419 [Naja naja]
MFGEGLDGLLSSPLHLLKKISIIQTGYRDIPLIQSIMQSEKLCGVPYLQHFSCEGYSLLLEQSLTHPVMVPGAALGYTPGFPEK